MDINPIKTKYTEVLEFFRWFIPAYLPEFGFYIAGQVAPRMTPPYISVDPMVSIDRIGRDERRISNIGAETLRGQRIITSQLAAFTDAETRYNGFDNCWQGLQLLRFALADPPAYKKLSEINCRVLDEGIVNNTSQIVSTTNEARATLTLTLSTVIVQTIDSGSIETISGTGTVPGTDGSNISIEVSVTEP